ncbi:uncharacterized protein [Pyxicephalus adspersus]|uniref:uncharacterized protein n=1 Tax=Pyxicephalus adspersus TaxID=30357 RepID=UPI003B58D04A
MKIPQGRLSIVLTRQKEEKASKIVSQALQRNKNQAPGDQNRYHRYPKFLVKNRDLHRMEPSRRLLDRDNISHENLLRELPHSFPDDYKNYLRMSDVCFQQLLSAVGPFLQKQDTFMRKSITPEQFPDTPEEWLAIASEFQDLWNFPNCGGAIDGKHVRITPLADSGLYYYNYKGFFSIVLMAILNARYEFVLVDIGRNGRMSDEGVLDGTPFHTKLMNEQLHLPRNSQTVKAMNFVFVADEAFALHENLIKPYTQKKLEQTEKIF